jgi:hypothetical protein
MNQQQHKPHHLTLGPILDAFEQWEPGYRPATAIKGDAFAMLPKSGHRTLVLPIPEAAGGSLVSETPAIMVAIEGGMAPLTWAEAAALAASLNRLLSIQMFG